MAVQAQSPAPEPEQDLPAAARAVAALFGDHPFVPRTWVEVQRFVAAVARADAPSPAPAPGAEPLGRAPSEGAADEGPVEAARDTDSAAAGPNT